MVFSFSVSWDTPCASTVPETPLPGVAFAADGTVASAARHPTRTIDSYQLRSAAHQALIRVQLVCDDVQALEPAASAFEVTNCMHEAPDEADRSQRSEQARETLSELIGAAAPGVR